MSGSPVGSCDHLIGSSRRHWWTPSWLSHRNKSSFWCAVFSQGCTAMAFKRPAGARYARRSCHPRHRVVSPQKNSVELTDTGENTRFRKCGATPEVKYEKTLLSCSGSLVETTVSVCLSGPPYSTPIVININLFMKSALGVSTTP